MTRYKDVPSRLHHRDRYESRGYEWTFKLKYITCCSLYERQWNQYHLTRLKFILCRGITLYILLEKLKQHSKYCYCLSLFFKVKVLIFFSQSYNIWGNKPKNLELNDLVGKI